MILSHNGAPMAPSTQSYTVLPHNGAPMTPFTQSYTVLSYNGAPETPSVWNYTVPPHNGAPPAAGSPYQNERSPRPQARTSFDSIHSLPA